MHTMHKHLAVIKTLSSYPGYYALFYGSDATSEQAELFYFIPYTFKTVNLQLVQKRGERS